MIEKCGAQLAKDIWNTIHTSSLNELFFSLWSTHSESLTFFILFFFFCENKQNRHVNRRTTHWTGQTMNKPPDRVSLINLRIILLDNVKKITGWWNCSVNSYLQSTLMCMWFGRWMGFDRFLVNYQHLLEVRFCLFRRCIFLTSKFPFKTINRCSVFCPSNIS